MRYIALIVAVGLLVMFAREWSNWVHDVCDCMVNRIENGDKTE